MPILFGIKDKVMRQRSNESEWHAHIGNMMFYMNIILTFVFLYDDFPHSSTENFTGI